MVDELSSEISELERIKIAINEASDHTKKQIDFIDSNLYIGALLSIIVAIGLTSFTNNFPYWIYASFVLFILYGLFFLISQIFRRKNQIKNQSDLRKEMDVIFNSNIEKIAIGFDFIIKNVAPLIKAISINFLVSFLLIIYLEPSWFKVDNLLSYSPIIACLLWVFTPFLLVDITKKVKKLVENLKTEEGIKIFSESSFPIIIFSLIKGVLLLVVLVSMVILPFVSLWVVFPSGENISNVLPRVILVMIFQMVVILLLTSYFSALAAKKELSNSITNYSDLNSLINFFIIRKKTSEENVKQIKKAFFTAKLYDVAVDDSLLFIYVYMLIPNRTNVREVFGDNFNVESNAKKQSE